MKSAIFPLFRIAQCRPRQPRPDELFGFDNMNIEVKFDILFTLYLHRNKYCTRKELIYIHNKEYFFFLHIFIKI